MAASSTRERLVDSAMELFGSQGYRATTIAHIEDASGLSARSGAFYRHFSSKQAILAEVIDRWVADVVGFPGDVEALLPLDDLRAELEVIARGSMRVLDRQRPLFAALATDPAEMPALVERVHRDLVTPGYEQMTAWFKSRLRRSGRSPEQAGGLAAVALSSLAHFHHDQALYGSPPGNIGREEFVDAWILAWQAVLGPT